MTLNGKNDLRARMQPRLTTFHSIDTGSRFAGITYWRKAYTYMVKALAACLEVHFN